MKPDTKENTTMTPEQFVYWLRGYLDASADPAKICEDLEDKLKSVKTASDTRFSYAWNFPNWQLPYSVRYDPYKITFDQKTSDPYQITCQNSDMSSL